MTLYYAEGSATAEISDEQMREVLHGVLAQIGQRTKVLALPPDFIEPAGWMAGQSSGDMEW